MPDIDSLPPIIHVTAELGQGGTERSIELLATALEMSGVVQRVIALDRGGPTADRLSAAGVAVKICAGDLALAATEITSGGDAIVLLNRYGRPQANWNTLIRRLAGGRVTLIEVSHFGWLDGQAIADGLKGVFCVSGSALAKYLRQKFGHWPSADELRRLPIAVCAGNNPVDHRLAQPLPPRAALRRQLGLPVTEPIAIRVGRPDPRKWSDLLIEHGARLVGDIPDLHLLFLSAPPSRAGVVRRRLGDRGLLASFTTDRGLVQKYLAAADVMLHYARYGESFGYALAEAAVVGLPVVAQATPWGDNAQFELIRHGETGFVATGYDETRLYLQQVLGDPQLAAALGRAGRDHVVGSFGVGETWRLLRAFIIHVQAGGTGLLTAPTDLAAGQVTRLARGIDGYRERFPGLVRLAAEQSLYRHPWFWRLAARDLTEIAARRLAAWNR